ncbi:hypothetical protein [Bifidobacterium moukalabense]|nr:hypothetical protein [Bifidobacterium moukalabense]
MPNGIRILAEIFVEDSINSGPMKIFFAWFAGLQWHKAVGRSG